MKIHDDIEQGTLQWLQLHVGRPTASEFDNLMTPEFEKRNGEMPKTYLAKKVAEAWQQRPLPQFSSWACEQGLIREEEAIPWFEMEYDCTLRRVGFITSDSGRCGCSPDALIDDKTGLEIKSPEAHTHVRYLLSGELPKEYRAQVHGSLYVTGFPEWRFMSYRRGFPNLVLTVKRDEAIMAKIGTILIGFYSAFDAAIEKLRSLKSEA